MACIIYRDGKEIRVPPEHLQQYLDDGWTTEPVKPKAKAKQQKAASDEQQPEDEG